ncbi:MAG TPA: cyclopropane fatty acyl phospholipid synthase [Kofleriaceae bacterium]
MFDAKPSRSEPEAPGEPASIPAPARPARPAHDRRSSRARLTELLAHADIVIDGDRPWDPRVADERFFDVVFAGSLAIGEGYMDGLWDVPQLDELVCRFRRARLDERFRIGADGWRVLKARLRNRQSASRSYHMARRVYDGAIDLFEATLDPRMVYSCAYWKSATTLAEAQEAKLDLACRKLGLGRGMRVLDIGCGWGAFARYAAEVYGAEVVGVTVSREQVEYGRARCAGLPVEIRYQDYRDVTGTFDRVHSAGMFEHVGPRNHRRFFETVHRVLADDGLMLLHTVGGNRSLTSVDAWIDTYIFPDSVMPSSAQIARAIERLFVIEDWHNFGPDYDRTLMAWFANFDRNYPSIKDRYDQRFYRMWKFYLQACAGTFRARTNHLWHFVLSKRGVVGGYEAVR